MGNWRWPSVQDILVVLPHADDSNILILNNLKVGAPQRGKPSSKHYFTFLLFFVKKRRRLHPYHTNGNDDVVRL
jgi:hypothetical protein